MGKLTLSNINKIKYLLSLYNEHMTLSGTSYIVENGFPTNPNRINYTDRWYLERWAIIPSAYYDCKVVLEKCNEIYKQINKHIKTKK